VSPPELDGSPLRLRQVAAGLKVAWAITTDGSVWFRRGISIPDRPAGNGWVPMTGDMAQVSVGANDQVNVVSINKISNVPRGELYVLACAS
jgi:hypothetical protein